MLLLEERLIDEYMSAVSLGLPLKQAKNIDDLALLNDEYQDSPDHRFKEVGS